MEYLSFLIIAILGLVAGFYASAAHRARGVAEDYRERFLLKRELADIRQGHIITLQDKVQDMANTMQKMQQELDVVKAVNLGDNRFSTQRFEETQVMSIDGLITPYQKQK